MVGFRSAALFNAMSFGSADLGRNGEADLGHAPGVLSSDGRAPALDRAAAMLLVRLLVFMVMQWHRVMHARNHSELCACWARFGLVAGCWLALAGAVGCCQEAADMGGARCGLNGSGARLAGHRGERARCAGGAGVNATWCLPIEKRWAGDSLFR